MKAIILAAGKGTRLRPLTLTKPKVLLEINGKSILEHNLEILNEFVDEVIIVVGYLKEQIIKKIGLFYKDMRINYVEQKELLGTGHAVMQAAPLIWTEDEFLIMPGDDLFSEKDIARCLKHRYCVLAQEVDDPKQFGVFEEKDGLIIGIEEKPTVPKSNLANTALWKMDGKIFELMKDKGKNVRGEYEITDALAELIKTEKVYCEKVQGQWIAFNSIEQLEQARRLLSQI